MAVEIRELIIQGKSKGSSTSNEDDLDNVIETKMSEKNMGNILKESEKRQLVDECVIAILNELESKLRY
jgi:RNA-binding protein YlmH